MRLCVTISNDLVRLAGPSNRHEDQFLPLLGVLGDFASRVVELNIRPELADSKRLHGIERDQRCKDDLFALAMVRQRASKCKGEHELRILNNSADLRTLGPWIDVFHGREPLGPGTW